MKTCVFCELDFIPKSKNQKYCNPECCRKATNKKIMQKYYEKKERLNGKERFCPECKAKISRYNANDICTLCEARLKKEDRTMIMEGLAFIAKQIR